MLLGMTSLDTQEHTLYLITHVHEVSGVPLLPLVDS